MKEKIDYTKPVNISKDIWFYPTPKGFSFVVWVEIGGKKKATQFRLTHKKIKNYLN